MLPMPCYASQEPVVHVGRMAACTPPASQAAHERDSTPACPLPLPCCGMQLLGPYGTRSLFTTHDDAEWRLVRKATAPAFFPDNIRAAFPVLREVRCWPWQEGSGLQLPPRVPYPISGLVHSVP